MLKFYFQLKSPTRAPPTTHPHPPPTTPTQIATVFFATLAGLPEPLTPLQLLWVNLVTDGPPATALGFNPPDPDSMSRPPRPRSAPIMSPWLLTRYLVTGLYVGVATIGVMLW